MSRPTTKLATIERAAMRLFSQKGLAQVTIREIAQAAGCAEGTLYRHYRSKEEMAWALYARELSTFSHRLREVLQGPEDFAARVAGGVATFFDFFDEDQEVFTFILLTQHDFPAAKPLPRRVNPIDLVVGFVRAGAEQQEFHVQDPLLAGAMVLGLVLQPATMRVYGRVKGSLHPHIEEISAACLRVLQVGGGSSR